MEAKDCKIGATVRITQLTKDKGKVGKILSADSSSNGYWTIENCKHRYIASQMELVEAVPSVINNYQIY